VDGIERQLPATATLVLLGQSWTQPALLQSLRATQSLMAAVRDAHSQVRQARKALEDDVPHAHAFYTALSAALQGYFGKRHSLLSEFGVPLGTRRPPTGEVLVQAAAKARLTRTLRHTLGNRQRLAIVSKRPVIVIYGPDGKILSSTGPIPPA
jgi:hypothetical protein